jgi:hypothetical protein
MRPFITTDAAWAALAEQRGMRDGEDVLLRQCDDVGKDPAYRVQRPERFRAMLDRVAARVCTAPAS